ncbi:MAG TPA: aminodeoxychorismate lyase [Lachnospiraceae bacterium]|nr:aminodeoxychorismate lyase [Lachnospiraceae bacterium]
MKALNIAGAVAGAIFRLAVAIAVVYFIYQGAGICYDYGYRIFTEPAVSSGEGRTVTVTITESMTPMEIGELFESRGLVRDAKLFTLQYYLSEYRKDVGAGTFELSTAMTAEEMMAAMVVEKDGEEDGDAAGQGE